MVKAVSQYTRIILMEKHWELETLQTPQGRMVTKDSLNSSSDDKLLLCLIS